MAGYLLIDGVVIEFEPVAQSGGDPWQHQVEDQLLGAVQGGQSLQFCFQYSGYESLYRVGLFFGVGG